ncbi:hypothetical protein [Pseudomonas sp. R5(2019)]|nr:hypothetical protein [Pseudomonas sp. R5(2019)]
MDVQTLRADLDDIRRLQAFAEAGADVLYGPFAQLNAKFKG